MKEHPLVSLSRRYPQLLLPVKAGQRETEEYKSAVLGGEKVDRPLEFSMNASDSLGTVGTPAGRAEILYLADRGDFEHCVRCLAYRCEPADIPPSMGATSISGLIDWEKLRPHSIDDEDFRSFTADKSNYLSSLIILSSGDYSAVSAEDMGLEKADWSEKSVTVRKYHELTHFVSGKLFPGNKEAIRDEIIADMNGIIAAFGYYDTAAARRFLGIEGEKYREGGRLQNYTADISLDDAIKRAGDLIELFSTHLQNVSKDSIFDTLIQIEGDKTGL